MTTDSSPRRDAGGSGANPGLAGIARAWTKIGLTGFGGPPAHIALLRRLVVDRAAWMDAGEFEDANAACSLLPGPASTQLAIFCAYRVGGPVGAVVGGLGFVLPAVVLMLLLSTLFLAGAPPVWVRGAGAGAGAAVAAVAVHAARGLLAPRLAPGEWGGRWVGYLLAGLLGAALLGPYLVLVLLGCGLVEYGLRRGRAGWIALVGSVHSVAGSGTLVGLGWTALKVGALSFGGGFVIIPLMQGDAVHVHHWMTQAQFLSAVALGQITPGPVVATVAAVGYAADGWVGGLVAAGVAFAPSFLIVLVGGRRLERLRGEAGARAFLDGAGPAAIGAILGAAVTLAGALTEVWQFVVLAGAGLALVVARRGVVETLLAAGLVGALAGLAGVALP